SVHSLRSLGNSYQHERGDLEGSLEKWIVGTGRVSIPARAGGHRVRADLPRRWTDCAGWHTARRRRAIKEGLSSSPRADQSRPVNSEAEAELSPRCNLAKRHFARNIIVIHQIPHAFFHAADLLAIIIAAVAASACSSCRNAIDRRLTAARASGYGPSRGRDHHHRRGHAYPTRGVIHGRGRHRDRGHDLHPDHGHPNLHPSQNGHSKLLANTECRTERRSGHRCPPCAFPCWRLRPDYYFAGILASANSSCQSGSDRRLTNAPAGDFSNATTRCCRGRTRPFRSTPLAI